MVLSTNEMAIGYRDADTGELTGFVRKLVSFDPNGVRTETSGPSWERSPTALKSVSLVISRTPTFAEVTTGLEPLSREFAPSFTIE